MSKKTQIDRRTFLAAQTAVMAVGLGGTALAFEPRESRADWKVGTADQFSKLVNQRFTAFAQDGSMYHLVLTSVEKGKLDAGRPRSLRRSESATLYFKSVNANDLNIPGHETVTMYHPSLGQMDIFLSVIPKKSGGTEIEVIFN